MKTKVSKLLAPLLAGMMLLGSLAACGNPEDPGTSGSPEKNLGNPVAGNIDLVTEETKATTEWKTAGSTEGAETVAAETAAKETEATTDAENVDPAMLALEALGKIDGGNQCFTILYSKNFEREIVGVDCLTEGVDLVSLTLNNAVYTRNSLLEDLCNITVSYIGEDPLRVSKKVSNEVASWADNFQIVDDSLGDTATNLAPANFLYSFNDLGIDLTRVWWDDGMTDLAINGRLYFMSGSLNICDDDVTYALFFNQDLQQSYALPNPYDTVRNGEWTLDYFHDAIQGTARENGDGQWDEQDTYGFTTTWDYSNTFFLGADMRYVLNDITMEKPTLYLSDENRMERALKVLELSKSIYHDGATYLSTPGEEEKSLSAFCNGHSLFHGGTVNQLEKWRTNAEFVYGVLPVPKYDKAQESYLTWSSSDGSVFSVLPTFTVFDRETVGKIMEAYAILSHQHLKPAYDGAARFACIQDPDSDDMMDMILAHRVYDIGFHFTQLDYQRFFRDCVNANDDTFSRACDIMAKSFERAWNRVSLRFEDYT